jgi:hypothetical protein
MKSRIRVPNSRNAKLMATPRVRPFRRGATGGGAILDPGAILGANAISWFAPSVSTMEQDGAGTPVAAPGDPVGVIIDGVAGSWTAATDAARGIYREDAGVSYLELVDGQIMTLNPVNVGEQAYFIGVIRTADVVNDLKALVNLKGSGGNNDRALEYNDFVGSMSMIDYGDVTIFFPYPRDWTIIEWWWDGQASYVRLNGVLLAGAIDVPTLTADRIHIGGRDPDGQPWDVNGVVDIAALAVADTIPSNFQMQRLRSWPASAANVAPPVANVDQPRLVGVAPADGATAIPVDSTITLTFDRPVSDTGTPFFYLYEIDTQRNIIAQTVIDTTTGVSFPGDNTVVVTPPTDLTDGARYSFHLYFGFAEDGSGAIFPGYSGRVAGYEFITDTTEFVSTGELPEDASILSEGHSMHDASREGWIAPLVAAGQAVPNDNRASNTILAADPGQRYAVLDSDTLGGGPPYAGQTLGAIIDAGGWQAIFTFSGNATTASNPTDFPLGQVMPAFFDNGFGLPAHSVRIAADRFWASNPTGIAYLMTFWNNRFANADNPTPEGVNDAATWRSYFWRDQMNQDDIVAHVNAARTAGGSPAMRTIQWLQAWAAIHDNLGTAPATCNRMEDFMDDNVHVNDRGHWVISALMSYQFFGIDPADVTLAYDIWSAEDGQRQATLASAEERTWLAPIIRDVVDNDGYSGFLAGHTAPAAIAPAGWSLDDAGTGGTLRVTLTSVPANTTNVEYRIGGASGAWTDAGTTSGTFDIPNLINGDDVPVTLRCINLTGNGGVSPLSDTKVATPSAPDLGDNLFKYNPTLVNPPGVSGWENINANTITFAQGGTKGIEASSITDYLGPTFLIGGRPELIQYDASVEGTSLTVEHDITDFVTADFLWFDMIFYRADNTEAGRGGQQWYPAGNGTDVYVETNVPADTVAFTVAWFPNGVNDFTIDEIRIFPTPSTVVIDGSGLPDPVPEGWTIRMLWDADGVTQYVDGTIPAGGVPRNAALIAAGNNALAAFPDDLASFDVSDPTLTLTAASGVTLTNGHFVGVPANNLIADPFFNTPGDWFTPGNWTIQDQSATLTDPGGVRRLRNTTVGATAGVTYRVGFTVLEADAFALAPMVGTTYVGPQAATDQLGAHDYIFDPADAVDGDEFGVRNVAVEPGVMTITGFWALANPAPFRRSLGGPTPVPSGGFFWVDELGRIGINIDEDPAPDVFIPADAVLGSDQVDDADKAVIRAKLIELGFPVA